MYQENIKKPRPSFILAGKKVIKENRKAKKQLKTNERFTFWPWLKNRCEHYCSVTALHGWNHLIRNDFAKWEKILWGIMNITAMIVALTLLYWSLYWNSATPTVTVIESTHYPSWQIPFPAVTICNVNKIDRKNEQSRRSKMKLPQNMTVDHYYSLLRLMIVGRSSNDTAEQFNELHQILVTNNLTVETLVYEFAPRCSKMIEKCMWKGTQIRCDTIFQRVMTLKGVCCTFNFFGYRTSNYNAKSATPIAEPRRVSACGYQTGLSVILNPYAKDYVASSISSYGFRVLIHNPHSFPDDNAETKMIQSGLEAYVSVVPEATYSTTEVLSKELSVRKCFKDDEIKLSVMTKYTYVNCLAECRREILLRGCGCIAYNYPNDNEAPAPVCQLDKAECMSIMERFTFSAAPQTNFTLPTIKNTITDFACGCMPECTFNHYLTETSTGILSRKNSYSSESFFQGINLQNNQTVLHVFYNDLVSTRYRKDMFQNWMSVLAMFGGLTGLFLGFSLVTGYEIVYFFTIRVLFDVIAKQRKKRRKARMMKLVYNARN